MIVNSPLLPIQPFQETLHASMCGPASLKMVLQYYGIEASESEIAMRCDHNTKLGVTSAAIQAAAESFGLNVTIAREASFEDISSWLTKQVPVIVDWFSAGRKEYDQPLPDGHYSVVVGIDEENIYLQDPELGSLRTIAKADFLPIWFDFEGKYIRSWNDLIIRELIAIYQ